MVLTLNSMFQNMNPSLIDASRDLGSGVFGTFTRITFPLNLPGIIAGSLLGFVISWINVEVSIFNPTTSGVTLPVRIFNQVRGTVDRSMAATSAIIIYFAIATVPALDYFIGIEKTGMK